MRAWPEMDRILAIPWQFWALAMLALAALSFVRNSFKLRKQFGNAPTPEEIRKVYPRAWIIRLWRPKKRDPESN